MRSRPSSAYAKRVERNYYKPVKPEQLAELVTRLAERDLHLPEIPGETPLRFTGPHDVELEASYDPHQLRFELTILRKPFLIPAAHIWTRVAEAITPFEDDT